MALKPPSHETGDPDGLTRSTASSTTNDIGLMDGRSKLGSLLMGLPQELLIEIFRFTINEHGGQPNAVNPLLLGRICRSWRAMVFETWTFWQEVNLTISPHCSTQISLLAEWTARAGSLPLSVSIIDPKGLLNAKEELTRLLGLIRSLSPRIHSLALETLIPFYDEWQNCSLADYSWPLLSNLSLATTFEASTLSDPASRLDFSSCPMLTTATIKSFYHFYIPLPWRSLLHLRFDSVCCSEVYAALQSCTRLETLEVYGIVDDDPSPIDSVVQRPLKTLTLKLEMEDGSRECWRIVNSLRLPELRILEIKIASSRPVTGHKFDI
ncbi:hypothetical protein DFP72DRAFT_1069378 [Ephemerocybe angulata]|uniref:F-box domain-containing protein n=1 Tax=Ephemerocybe angulata TaxID=980116 RepID=A0A8H6HVK0_9AGAR|nr:hypothetical protein DFP72DRAFT_1069378 [Tulosesus angulatus]